MKTNKNRVIFLASLVVLALLIVALVHEKNYQHKKALEAQTKIPYGVTFSLDDTTGIGKAILILVNESETEITEDCPVDESFYYWVADTYGKSAVCDVAYKVHNGVADSNVWKEYTGSSIKTLYSEYCSGKGIASYKYNNVTWTNHVEGRSGSNVINVLGDVCLADNWGTMQALESRGGAITSSVSADLCNMFKSSALTWANNEFAFEDDLTALAGKAYTFGSATSNVKYWEDMGVNVVSLANNHVWDYGEEGVISTLDTLKDAGIDYVGAGKNLEEAENIKYYVINGKKIALVAATQVEIKLTYTKQATENSAGVLKTLDPELFCQVIKEADANADYVIAYVHWGWEGKLRPDETQKSLAQEFVNAGADVIIGNHSHRMQGVQFIDGVPVIYSLGNFLLSNSSQYTMVVQVEVKDNGKLAVGLVPCKQSDYKVSRITDSEEVKAFYEYVADLSYSTGISEDGEIHYRTGDPDGSYAYYSGEHYADRNPAVDLDGNAIDSVGNLR